MIANHVRTVQTENITELRDYGLNIMSDDLFLNVINSLVNVLLGALYGCNTAGIRLVG